MNIYLHPKEHLPARRFELEQVDPSGGALSDMLELHIIRENDEILDRRENNIAVS